jgi:putative Holliday junction resolvase
MSTVIGVDYGTKHLGLAVSDKSQRIAEAIPPKVVRNARHAQETLGKTVKHLQAGHILYGLPTGVQNKETQMSKEVRAFAEAVYDKNHVPYSFWNESYTSHQAERLVKRSKKEKSHSEAARIILQEYLDFLATGI